MMKRSLGENLFVAIFGTFGRYATNLRGTFVENVKNQHTLLYSTVSGTVYQFSFDISLPEGRLGSLRRWKGSDSGCCCASWGSWRSCGR
jgi:hypothetical protein